MEEKLTIDKQTIKALVVETRLDILKLLTEKPYTLSDIATILSLKKSTILEHLKVLEESGLVKKEETKRKWKFYSLTLKGRKLVQPKEVAVFFAFIIHLFAIVGTTWALFAKILSSPSSLAQESSQVMRVMSDTSEFAVQESVRNSFVVELTLLLVVIVLTTSAGFLLGYLFKRSIYIIGGIKK